MKLASYKVRGRESFGAVVGNGAGAGRGRSQAAARAALCQRARSAAREAGLDFAREAAQRRARRFLRYASWNGCRRCWRRKRSSASASTTPTATPTTATPRRRNIPACSIARPARWSGIGQPIVRPRESEQLDYEGEIALVIGRAGRRIAPEQALDHVAGVTLCNEGTIRDWIAARQVQRDAGQELGCQRQHRPVDRDRRRDRSRPSRCTSR